MAWLPPYSVVIRSVERRPPTVNSPTPATATSRGGLFDTTGTVEFRAHHRDRGRPGALHERSRFRREDGRWAYLDGLTDPT